MTGNDVNNGTREITFGQAINEALHEEMQRDGDILVVGEDVGRAGGVYKITQGLYDAFGAERVLDSPISEAGITGLGVGAALSGQRPVVEIMFGDFTALVMDQIVNQAAKIHYMSGGKWRVPMVLRTTMGAGRRAAAQHSQSLHAWYCHIPGLKVVLPSSPYDAKGLLKSAIRDDSPVIFFEDKMMYRESGPVPAADYSIPLGVAAVRREGEGHHPDRHLQHGQRGADGGGRAGRAGHQRRGDRPAHAVPAGRGDAGGVRAQDLALHRD